jgi:2'-5' RNA ligase
VAGEEAIGRAEALPSSSACGSPARPSKPQWTVPNLDGDFSAWHRGRIAFAFWGIELGGGGLDARLASARRQLEGFLRPGYRRQAHLTIAVCGFPSLSERLPDDFTPERLDRQIRGLQALGPAPFDIEIGRLASFSSAAYLRAEASPRGALDAIRRCLVEVVPEPPDWRYTPHVTIGLYRDRRSMADIGARIHAFEDGATISMPADALALMTYDPADLEGPLDVSGRFDLASRTWRTVEGAASGGDKWGGRDG